MASPPNAQLSHFGIFVRNMETMVDFYTRFLGMVVSDSGDYARGGRIFFLTRNPNEHHQLVLAEGRSAEMGLGQINQVSFRLDTLEDLRWYYRELTEQSIRIDRTLNHGNAWSIYLFDPEDNRIELYATAPWYVRQPYGKPLDLTRPAEEILNETKAMVLPDPSYRSLEQWSADLDRKIKAGPPS